MDGVLPCSRVLATQRHPCLRFLRSRHATDRGEQTKRAALNEPTDREKMRKKKTTYLPVMPHICDRHIGEPSCEAGLVGTVHAKRGHGRHAYACTYVRHNTYRYHIYVSRGHTHTTAQSRQSDSLTSRSVSRMSVTHYDTRHTPSLAYINIRYKLEDTRSRDPSPIVSKAQYPHGTHTVHSHTRWRTSCHIPTPHTHTHTDTHTPHTHIHTHCTRTPTPSLSSSIRRQWRSWHGSEVSALGRGVQ
jgi:hypothetical protein